MLQKIQKNQPRLVEKTAKAKHAGTSSLSLSFVRQSDLAGIEPARTREMFPEKKRERERERENTLRVLEDSS